MARSYRKTPIIKDRTKNAKKHANRKVRRLKDIPSGGQYRKYYSQYDVCDWVFYKTLNQAIVDWYRHQAPHNITMVGRVKPEDVVKNWAKNFFWK